MGVRVCVVCVCVCACLCVSVWAVVDFAPNFPGIFVNPGTACSQSLTL